MRGLPTTFVVFFQVGVPPGAFLVILIVWIIIAITRRWLSLGSLCRLLCGCGQCREGVVLPVTGVSPWHTCGLCGGRHLTLALWCSTTRRYYCWGYWSTTTSSHTLPFFFCSFLCLLNHFQLILFKFWCLFCLHAKFRNI